MSLNLGLASIWLLFLPCTSFAPLHSTSATAQPRGQIMRSRFRGSVCSAHIYEQELVGIWWVMNGKTYMGFPAYDKMLQIFRHT
jgi:hypothetical protein